MALSTAVMVGQSKDWIPELVEKAKKLKVNAGTEINADLGPVISPEAKKKIESLITSGEKEGAKIVLDGRNTTVEGKVLEETLLLKVRITENSWRSTFSISKFEDRLEFQRQNLNSGKGRQKQHGIKVH